ncbi:MAG: ATP-binding protein [Desulfocapsa sp.]|nr:ATP-binding protein [Desulfocapsa sp.]
MVEKHNINRMESDTIITRSVQARIEERLFKGKAIILFGPRQAGKTTLISNLLQSRSEQILSLNGDEPDVRELLTNCTSTQLRSLIGKNKIIFIDEAQRIPEIGLTLKLITDQIPDVQVIATGSSAFELNSYTAESLTGRKFEFKLYPLSCAELIEHHSFLEEKRFLEHRLIYGSYPEIITTPGHEEELIKLLAGSYLYKDLLTLEQINKPVLLEKILRALALQLGSEISYQEIGQLVSANSQTVEKYIDLLEKAFVLFRLPALNRNVRNEIKKGKKIYFYDNGIRNAIIGNFTPLASRTDTGPLWENYLISERLKMLANRSVDSKCYFWRTTQQQEIDYIEERQQQLFIYEFKWNVKKGHTRFPKTFLRNYENITSKVITPANYDEFLYSELT